ncbi:MAG: leucine-rich repeat protein [Bacilli bacterium]|nr:leucine-rich repeat protein [Bacilli bacterium]
MKKTVLVTPIMFGLFLVNLTSCGANNDHFVTFECNGGTPHIETQRVKDGAKATRPADPTADFGTFIDWYSDEECTHVYDFNTPVTNDITLYADYDTTVSFTFIGQHCTINNQSEFVETRNYNEFVTYEIAAESVAYSIEDSIVFRINGVESKDYTYDSQTGLFSASCKGDASLTITAKKMLATEVSVLTEDTITSDYVIKFDYTIENDDGPFFVDWGDGNIDSKCIHPYLVATKNPKITIYGNVSKVSFADIDGPYTEANKCVNKIVFPGCVNDFPDYAFNGIEKLEKIHLPDKMKNIGVGAFSGTNLKECVFPTLESKTIAANTFLNCSNLETVFIPNGITTIDTAAFSGCTNLGELILRKDVVSVKKDAFKECTLLRLFCLNEKGVIIFEDFDESSIAEIEYGCAGKNIDTTGQYSCLVKKNSSQAKEITILECLKLNDDSGKVVIPRELTVNAINGSETLPVTSIGYQAFSSETVRDLVKEVDFTMNPGVVLDVEAFRGCHNLATLTFETSYAARGNNYHLKFDDRAFMNCYALAGDTPVILYYDTIASMGSDVFKMDNGKGCQVWCEEEIKPDTWEEDWNVSGITNYGLCYIGNDTTDTYKVKLYHDNQKTKESNEDKFYISIVSKINPKVTTWTVEETLKISGYERASDPIEVRVIDESCMAANTNIQTVEAPTVTVIKRAAFNACSNLKVFKFSPKIKEIEHSAFFYTTMPELNIDKENAEMTVLHDIGGSFRKITLPNSLKSIDNGAFCQKPSLETIDYDADKCQLESVGASAFYMAESLKIDELNLKCAEFLGDGAFNMANSVTTVSLPNAVTCENAVFYACNLISITFGQRLQELGTNIFGQDFDLETIDLSQVQNVPNVVGDNIGIRPDATCKIYVPEALFEDFKKHKSWSKYANKFVVGPPPAPSAI